MFETLLTSSDDEAFIDRLESGETETITFAISAGGSALSKSYPVSLDFQYDDADGDTLLSDTYQVPVTVEEPEGGEGCGGEEGDGAGGGGEIPGPVRDASDGAPSWRSRATLFFAAWVSRRRDPERSLC